MKRIVNKKVLSLLLAIILLSTIISDVNYASTQVVITKKNMLNVKVVDENGNPVSGADVELYDLAGNKVFGWTSKLSYDNYRVKYGDITTENELYVSADTFSDYVDGEATLVRKKTPENNWGWSSVFVYEGEETIVETRYIPNMETAYTVNPNQYVIYVDPLFAGRTFETYLEVGDTKYAVNNYAGMRTFDADTGVYDVMTGLDNSSGGGSNSVITVSDKATEYIKWRVKLSEISSEFSDDGTYTSDGVVYSLKSDTDDKAFRIVFFSGAVISLAVPDENGYVEIYVEKSTREFSWGLKHVSGLSSSGGGGSSDKAEIMTEFTIPKVDTPEEGINIYNIPAGTYTLKVADTPYEYVIPEEQTITINDSNKFNYASIELHSHEYGTEYKKDETGHWYECACGDKSGFAGHISSGEATEFEAEVCTKCGYEIAPALGHTYGTEYKKDETGHWYECACGDKSGFASHISSGEATEFEAEVCTKCGYEIAPALGHTYGTEYKKDETGHWYECACGDKGGFAGHISSGEATEFEAEVCTKCGYEIAPALGHTYGTEYEKDETGHWYECACGDKANIAEHEFKWIIDKETEVGVNGSKHEECVLCGYKKEVELIPALKEETSEVSMNEPTEETTKKQEVVVAPTTGDSSIAVMMLLIAIISIGTIVLMLGKKKITE